VHPKVIPHRLRHPTSGLGQEPSRNIVGFPFYRGRIADEEEGRWQRRGGSSMRTSGRVPHGVARRDIRRARIGRSEIGGVAAKRAANQRDNHCIQCSAGDVSMLSETVHGRLLMTRNARPLARQQV
jgi:hypothetical protein